MSEYRVKETGEVLSQGQLRKKHSNVSLPRVWGANVMEALGIEPVLAAPKPDTTELQTAVRNGVEQDAKGNWVYAWTVRDMFSDQVDENGTVIKTKAEQEAEYQEKQAKALMDSYSAAVQNLLDSTAKEKGYDSIISMTSYANSSNAKWAGEATAAITWRDACWNESLVQMGTYLATGKLPSKGDFLAAMPTPVWPE